MSTAETDPVRRKIVAAMDRLIDGKPLHSAGRLNVSQLALEAGVARWHLTHQHVDLKEQFQAYVRREGTTPAPFRGTEKAYAELQLAHRALQTHCAELEERIKLYANVIQMLSTELATNAQALTVTSITARQRAPQ